MITSWNERTKYEIKSFEIFGMFWMIYLTKIIYDLQNTIKGKDITTYLIIFLMRKKYGRKIYLLSSILKLQRCNIHMIYLNWINFRTGNEFGKKLKKLVDKKDVRYLFEKAQDYVDQKIKAKKVLSSFLKIFGFKFTVLLFPLYIASWFTHKNDKKDLDSVFYNYVMKLPRKVFFV